MPGRLGEHVTVHAKWWLWLAVACAGDATRSEDPAGQREACNRGDGKACYELGARYQLGVEAPRDLERAIAFWQRGCELGSAPSCGQLGTVMEHGLAGRTRNLPVARRFYKRACDGGDAQACRSLGVTDPDR